MNTLFAAGWWRQLWVWGIAGLGCGATLVSWWLSHQTVHESGNLRWVLLFGGVFLTVFFVMQHLRLQADVRRHARAKQELTTANRALTLLEQCHKLVNQEKNEVVILARACALLVEVGGYRFAWCGFVEGGGEPVITPVAHSKLTQEELYAFRKTWIDSGNRQEPACTTIRNRAPTLMANLVHDVQAGEWRTQAVRHGYAATLAVPMLDGERLFGVLSIYSARPHAFVAAEIELMTELANTLAFGVVAIRESKRRKQAEKDLAQHRRILEEQVAKRTRVLNSVAAIAQRLLFQGGWHQNIDAALQDLGSAANVSRSYLLKAQIDENNTILITLIHEWMAPGIQSQIEDAEHGSPLDRFGLARWRERFVRGDHLFGRTRDFPEEERAFLNARGILSIAVMPILVHDRLWGLLGFEDCRRERTWSSGEIDAMQLAANTLDAAIRRDRLLEEKRADQAVIQKLSTAVEQSPNIVLITDAAGRIEYVNSRFTQLTGFDAGEVQGSTPAILQADSRSDQDHALMWDALRNGHAWREESQIVRKDGTRFWVHASLSPLVNNDGLITHFVCTQEDVTHRKQAELQLRETFDKLARSENRLQAILDNMPSLVFLKDPTGRYLLANRLFHESFRLDPDVVIGHRDQDLFSEEIAQGFAESDRTVLQRGVASEVDMIVPLGDEKRIFHTIRFPVVADDSGCISICGIATDITDRRIAQARLLRSKQAQDILNGLLLAAMERSSRLRDFLQDGLERILVAPWFVPDGRGAIHLFGAGENGCDVVCQIGLPDAGSAARASQAFLETVWGRNTPGIRFMTSAHWPGGVIPGLRGPWGYYSAPLFADGPVKGVMQIFLPPGHVCGKDEEDFLGTVRNTLASIVDKMIVDRQLILAKEKAESASHAKSTFLANMSHEVRTPMNGVIGMLTLLGKTRMNPIQRQYLAVAIQSAELQLNILNDILDFSKIEAGKLTLERIPFDWFEVVDSIGTMLSGTAFGKGLEVVLHLSCRIHPVWIGDAVRLRQVLINLAGNAIKFTQSGEVIIRADLVEENTERVRVRFHIIDTGIGIEEQARERLFQPFVQADDSTTRRFGGTGLGLVISRQIVESMGGTIGLASQPGGGSMFWFEIEFAKELTVPPASWPDFGTVRVLVVDDNDTNRMVLEHYFHMWGMHCQAVAGGVEALQLLRMPRESHQPPFDLAVVDMRMPGMDGLELARAIRQDPAIPQMKVLMLSCGIYLEESVLQEAGIGAVVMKPVGPHRLVRALEGLMGLASAGVDGRGDESGMRGEVAFSGKVLLVEDTFVNQQVAASMLKQLGLEVEIARDGEEGVAKALAGRPDVILMDMQMPVMDGLEATRRIREWEGLRGQGEIPIVAMTANALSGDRERCLEAGMNDYLPKPVLWDGLVAKLSQWLPKRDGKERVAPSPVALEYPDEGKALFLDPECLERFWHAMKAVPGAFSLVIEEFLESTPNLLEAIERGGMGAEPEVVRAAAHSLKSNSATVGAMALSELCAVIEKSARERDTVPALRLHPAAMAAFQAAIPGLRAALARESLD
ncbi:MAG: response regulator [Magnetococcales bacterium]|nr:response regulator [Magnetococcales bacterium]NGZ06683.1 response regulator [Magnetococcales bacterium]